MSAEFAWLEEPKVPARNKKGWVESVDGENAVQPVTGTFAGKTLERKRRPAALVEADKQLTLQQRAYRDCVINATNIQAANAMLRDMGFTVTSGTLARWRRLPRFAKALELAYQYLCECTGLSRSQVLVRLEQIRDHAMAGRRPYKRGNKTHYTDVDLGSALKALDQASKVLGLYGDQKSSVAVQLVVDFGAYGEPGDVIEGETVDAD